jgi:hypothetical protein
VWKHDSAVNHDCGHYALSRYQFSKRRYEAEDHSSQYSVSRAVANLKRVHMPGNVNQVRDWIVYGEIVSAHRRLIVWATFLHLLLPQDSASWGRHLG